MADVQHVHYVIFDREKDAVNVRLLAYKSWRTSRESVNFPVPADIVQEMS